MVRFNDGVDLNGIKPEMVSGFVVVASVYTTLGYDCIPTSINDGVHGFGSLHYIGMAMDFRIRHVREDDRVALKNMIAEALGEQFDVVLETTHIHVEYQPKK